MPNRIKHQMPRIYGYAFNAALCCPACTRIAYETEELRRQIPPKPRERLDQHGLPDDLCNCHGEPVTPVFSTDDYPDGFTCDECGELHPDPQTPNPKPQTTRLPMKDFKITLEISFRIPDDYTPALEAQIIKSRIDQALNSMAISPADLDKHGVFSVSLKGQPEVLPPFGLKPYRVTCTATTLERLVFFVDAKDEDDAISMCDNRHNPHTHRRIDEADREHLETTEEDNWKAEPE
jgi:hypothetical protein